MFKNKRLTVLYYSLLTLSFFLFAQKAHALPQEFKKVLVAENFNAPTAFTQTPDGRIFVLEKPGDIEIVKNGTRLAQPLLHLNVDSDVEKGLLGIALDPSFTSNGFMYIFYVNKTPLEIRVSRFTVTGDTASLGSEVILLKSTQFINQIHHAGTIKFGLDGKLWISIGNNGINGNSQDLSNIHGKILRINKNGTIPADNPFFGQSGKKGEIWAYGFRNPYRFNLLPNGKPIVGDVGEATWEEVDIVEKGGNYGWPNAEGSCTGCPYINPAFSYNHNGGSASITGGFLYTSNSSLSKPFPTAFNNMYFYGDYAKGFIRTLHYDADDGHVHEDEPFDDEAGTVVDLDQGKDGSLYYLTIVPGALMRIEYTNENLPPVAKITTDIQSGPTPLTVRFSSNGSYDPEGKPLTYHWQFGDGQTSTEANPTHVYTVKGIYTATLTVNDGLHESSTISFPIHVGNKLPEATIVEPKEGATYNAGEIISFSAVASDYEDGTLPESAFAWQILFRHGTHTHPFLTLDGKKSGTFKTPNTGESSADTWFDISLTVKDSTGLTTTLTRSIHPNTVQITIDAKVKNTSQTISGSSFTLDGIPHTTPYTFTGIVGFKQTLDVPTPQSQNGQNYDFASWSDGLAKTHTITLPSIPTTLTVFFSQAGTGQGHLHFRVREFDTNGGWTGKFINGATAKLTDPSGVTVLATETSRTINNQDGWVYFDNIPSGTYGALSYKSGYQGYWKQTNCQTQGTTQDATVQNTNTQGIVATWQTPITISANQITWCKDAGLKVSQTGNLFLRVRLIENKPNGTPSSPSYPTLGFINDATVKLTDPTGSTVYQTVLSQKSPSGDDGWAFFKDVKEGTYAVLAYKAGLTGLWRQTGCTAGFEVNATITNQNTDNHTAAWKTDITLIPGITNYCHDLGLTTTPAQGHIHFRVREFDGNGNWTGKFINGATAKLTDTSGETVIATETSKTINNEEGWVYFDFVKTDDYAILAYKDGFTGFWKQTNCLTGGTNQDATIQNQNTQNSVAAWNNGITVSSDKITWCSDLGLKNHLEVPKLGHVHYRVREFDTQGNWTGKFINGAKAKLTDQTGTTVHKETTSQAINGEDGWVYFDFVPEGTYATLTYSSGRIGHWQQIDCNTAGSTQNVGLINQNTEGISAAYYKDIQITGDQVTWCKDIGLKTN